MNVVDWFNFRAEQRIFSQSDWLNSSKYDVILFTSVGGEDKAKENGRAPTGTCDFYTENKICWLLISLLFSSEIILKQLFAEDPRQR